jgi:hypothetical protein
MMNSPKNQAQAGFTLIEVLLAFVLGVMVIGIAINFYSQGQAIYTKAQKQVDAQSQLRLAMTHIKRELSVATNVEVIDAPMPGSYEDGYFYFYVKNDTMVIKEGSAAPKSLPGCLPLHGMKVYFSKSSLKVNMIHVKIMSEGVELNIDIMTQNTEGGDIEDEGQITERTTVKFKRIN